LHHLIRYEYDQNSRISSSLPRIDEFVKEADTRIRRSDWRSYEDALITAMRERATAETVIAPAVALENSRESRLQAFVSKTDSNIAAVRIAAKVAKPDMQKWRHGTLPESSKMSRRIEKVLGGETPLQG
jgi:hypothetical protein